MFWHCQGDSLVSDVKITITTSDDDDDDDGDDDETSLAGERQCV